MVTGQRVGGKERRRGRGRHGELPHWHAPVPPQPLVVRRLEQVHRVLADVVRRDHERHRALAQQHVPEHLLHHPAEPVRLVLGAHERQRPGHDAAPPAREDRVRVAEVQGEDLLGGHSRPQPQRDDPARARPDHQVKVVSDPRAGVTLQACQHGGSEDPAHATAIDGQHREAPTVRDSAHEASGTVVLLVGQLYHIASTDCRCHCRHDTNAPAISTRSSPAE